MKQTELLKKERYGFEDLLEVMRILRSPEGCPWDREQTHKSIRNCMIEEAYEAVEAIDTDNPELLREELGDVLFQVVFHARLEEEKQVFDVNDVINDVCAKMIHRHPHVFADGDAATSSEVLTKWESIKTEEKQRVTLSSQLRAVPPMLPALMRASKICKKSGVADGMSAQTLAETIRSRATTLNGTEDTGAAIGDLLLAIVQYSRACGVDAEQALGQAIESLIANVEAEELKKL